MGALDHRRTWHYDVAATPTQCIAAFQTAFSTGGAMMRKAKWRVQTSRNSGSAVYQGRAGFAAAAGILSQTSAQEADTAIGSEVAFQITGTQGGRTQCSIALTSSGRSGIAGIFGATSDARFIRPYMQAVTSELKKLDPGARITSA